VLCRRRHKTNKLTWTRLAGQGIVYTFVVVHHVVTPGFPADQPYVVAWIELAEQAGLRLLSNVVGCPPETVYIGQEVELCFEDVRDGISVPVFTPAKRA
jgi:uncharacterized OB-fold protein